MPNSYCENPEYGIDGVSLSDWHTGSGCVLIKEIVKYGFGICPGLDTLKIQTPKCFPAKRGKISLRIRNCDVTLIYENTGRGERKIETEGAECYVRRDALMDVPVATLSYRELGDKLTVRVTD